MDMSANTSYAVNLEIARLYAELRSYLYSDGRMGLIPVEAIQSSINAVAGSATYLLGVREAEARSKDFLEIQRQDEQARAWDRQFLEDHPHLDVEADILEEESRILPPSED